MPTVYLSLGSNMGDRAANLRSAIDALDGPGMRIIAVSSIYESAPLGVTDQPAFLNCAASGETDLAPSKLLEYTQSVERACGRAPSFRWGPRVIDIDILLYYGVTLESRQL